MRIEVHELRLMRSPIWLSVVIASTIVLCSFLNSSVAGQTPVRGTVKIDNLKASPTQINSANKRCTMATVGVEVNKNQFQDNPTVFVSLQKRKSTPPELKVDIEPQWMRVTISGTSAF